MSRPGDSPAHPGDGPPRLDLSPGEELLLHKSSQDGPTRRRLRYLVASGLLLAAALVVLTPLVRSWPLLLVFAVAYILLTTWERVAYARGILAYKSLVRKLARRIAELERPRSRPPPVS